MGRIVNQVLNGVTAALSQPFGLSHCIFNRVRSHILQLRDFTSRVCHMISNLFSLSKQAAFVVLY
jgi:hypothetical protein